MKPLVRFLIQGKFNACVAAFILSLVAILLRSYAPSVAVLFLSTILLFLAVTIVSLVTFEKGPWLGLKALVWVLLPALSFDYYIHSAMVNVVFIIEACMVWCLSTLVYRQLSWADILTIVMVLGIVVLLIIDVFYSSYMYGIEKEMVAAVKQLTSGSATSLLTAPAISALLTSTLFFVDAISILFMMFLACYGHSLVSDQTGFAQFYHLRARKLDLAIVAIAIVLSVTLPRAGLSSGLFGFFMCGVYGQSLLAAFAKKTQYKHLIWGVSWLGLIFFAGLYFVIMASWGLIDGLWRVRGDLFA